MATCKFKIGDRVIVGESNIGNQYIGQVGVVADIDCTYDYPYCVNGTSYGNRLWCKVTGCEEKIVITHDGKTTTATKYCADGSKVTATARCAPEDEFDFNVGAKLAMERLMEKTKPVEWRVVDRPAQPGDYFRLKRVDYPDIDKLGDILKADGVKHGMIYVLEKNHPHCEDKTSEFHWNYTRSEYEVVEKVTPNEPPKYYNGKVVCVDTGYTDLTVGKIYTFVDGCGKSDDGGQITKSPVKDFNDLASRFRVTKFIEIVEDENKPLTIEEIRKMDGQKVYVVRLDGGKVETPDHSYCGWHTVNLKENKLIDSNRLYYYITSMDEAHGYHAYRTKPTAPTK